MSRRPESLHHYLRSGTRDLHVALDGSIRDRGYLGSLPAFREFLARTLIFHTAAEAALESAGIRRLIADWSQRRRAHLLRDDLAALHASDEPKWPAGLSECFAMPWADAHLLGAAYVLEGSTLGARAMLRALEPLGVLGRADAFLRAGESPDRRWHSFRGLLDLHDTDDFDRAAALDSARSTFRAARFCYG
jgi:heme oxygenase